MAIVDSVDNFFYKILKENHHPLLKAASKVGGVAFCSLLLIALLFIPYEEKFTLYIHLLASLTAATITVFILKYTVRRRRVSFNKSGFIKKYDPYSFPSGHLSRLAAFIIPFLAVPFAPYIFGLLCLISLYARVSRRFHYMTDCLAGFAIGLLSSLIVMPIYPYFLPLIRDILALAGIEV